MRPVRGNADGRVVEIRAHRIGREERPVAHHDGDERNPLHADRPHAQQEEERVAQANLGEGILEREVGLAGPIERRKIPRKTSTSDRQTACAAILPGDCPRASRLASENGSATPTRNENDGWIMSWSTQPIHSTCDWWWQRNS